MAGLKAVLFDFGDTLFSSPDGAAVMVEAGVDPVTARALWQEIWLASKTSDALAQRRDLSPQAHRAGWIALFARADSQVPGLSEILYRRVMDPRNWIPYPDAFPTLEALHARGIAIAVVSNVVSDLRPVFEHHGLATFVSAFVHSFEHGLEKPHPNLFLAACEQLGVEPAEALMVGDSYLGDGGAVDAGLTVVLLPPVEPGAIRGLDKALRLA